MFHVEKDYRHLLDVLANEPDSPDLTGADNPLNRLFSVNDRIIEMSFIRLNRQTDHAVYLKLPAAGWLESQKQLSEMLSLQEMPDTILFNGKHTGYLCFDRIASAPNSKVISYLTDRLQYRHEPATVQLFTLNKLSALVGPGSAVKEGAVALFDFLRPKKTRFSGKWCGTGNLCFTGGEKARDTAPGIQGNVYDALYQYTNVPAVRQILIGGYKSSNYNLVRSFLQPSRLFR